MCMEVSCSTEQAASFVHIAEELIAVAARINAQRDAGTSAVVADHQSGSWEAPPLAPQLAMHVADVSMSQSDSQHGARASIVWDAERLQCLWRHVQRYHIQLNGKRLDMEELMRSLGSFPPMPCLGHWADTTPITFLT